MQQRIDIGADGIKFFDSLGDGWAFQVGKVRRLAGKPKLLIGGPLVNAGLNPRQAKANNFQGCIDLCAGCKGLHTVEEKAIEGLAAEGLDTQR